MGLEYQIKTYREPKKNITEIDEGITPDKNVGSTSTPTSRIMPKEFNSTSEPIINKKEGRKEII